MNLTLDIGNTYAKLAVFDKNLVLLKTFNIELIYDNIDDFLKLYPTIKSLIVCSVTDYNLNFDKYNFNNIHFVSEKSNIPFINLYSSKNSLGNDRIALVSSASINYPNKNVLIIDAGSCITYDFINNKNQYLGGAISPGVNMRFKSLNNYTSKLPLVTPFLTELEVGTDTLDSINIGVLNGVIFEIEGFIAQYSSRYDNLTVILTGGNSDFLSNQLKISIFANQNFLLEGLNHLIKLNISS
jgi:type III pantothenate kinase